MAKINVLAKKPGEKFYKLQINNSLEVLQDTVGGPSESVTIAEDMAVICNEEGRLRGLEHNCEICGIGFCGTVLLVGVAGEEFTDVPIDEEAVRWLIRDFR